MTLQEINARKREINDQLSELEGRELNAEEQASYDALTREWKQLNRQIEIERIARENKPEPKNKREQLREVLQEARHSVQREVIVGTEATPGAGLNSGAIDLTIADLVPSLEAGTALPTALKIVQGVTGDVVFPTDASDMELEEAGEVAVLNDQSIDFDHVKAVPARVTLSCDISNKLIDNLHFDVLAFLQSKIDQAFRLMLATKVYSQAAFTGLKGGFSGLTAAGTITIGANTAANILAAVADFTDKGFNTDNLCIVLDAATEARLKVTPVASGQGGFIIQDGRLLGYEYVVTGRLNTVLGGDAKTAEANTDTTKLYPTTAKYIGFGFFNYLKVQQHGEYRLSIDGTSKAQAKKNCVGVTLNTEISITNLSQHIHDANGNAVSAFAVYTVA